MSHDEFYSLTPREFLELLEGDNVRFERKFRLIGWQVANLLQPHLKKGSSLTIDKLCGRERLSVEKNNDSDIPNVFTSGDQHADIVRYFANGKRRQSKSPISARR